jgi:hypothetical protein
MSTGFEWHDDRGQKHDANLHVDRNLIALFGGIFTAILIQTGSFVWWASGVNMNISEQARRLAIVELWHETQTTQGAAIARLDEKLGAVATRLDKIETRLFHTNP